MKKRIDIVTQPPEDTLSNIQASGAPAKKRVESVEAARQIYDDCVLDSEPLAKVRARIRGVVGGNPPLNPAELTRLGQGWRANFNPREAEAIIDTNAAALWEMQHDTFVAARFCPVDPSIGYSTENGLDYGDILSQEYTRTLKKWANWPVYTDLTIHDAMESGMGAMLWADDSGVLPKWYNISHFTFPKRASCSVDDLEFFFIRDEIPLYRLFAVTQKPEVASGEGWNVEAVKDYLVHRFGFGTAPQGGRYGEEEYRMSGWEAVQQMLVNNDAGVQRKQFDGVPVVRMYVREVEEPHGITQVIFTEEDAPSVAPNSSFSTAPENKNSFGTNFLFEKQRQFKSMSQVLWWVLYGFGDGFLSSIKGLGHRIVPHCEVSNRLICATFDSGILSSSLLLKPLTAVDFSKVSIMRVGPFTYLPENMEAVQTSYNPKIDALLLLRSMSSAILDNNAGVFRTKNENPLKKEGEKTAKQVMSEDAKEARFEKNQAAAFYVQWDFFHREMFRRLCSPKAASILIPPEERQIAKSFRDRCIKRGVPEALLKDELWEVTAERAIGLGSPGMRLDVTGQLLSVMGMMPEENQIHAKREFAAARVGAQHVDRFFPLKPKSMFTSDAASIATLENNDFNEASWVPVGSDQPHGIHLPVHFTPLVQIMQAFGKDEAGVDARKAYAVFSVAVPHIQQHLGYMANDHLPVDAARHAKFQEYVKLFKEITEFVGRLQGVVEKQVKAEQNAQRKQMDEMQKLAEAADNRKFEVEKYKIDREAELKRYEADLLHQSRMIKTNTSIEASVRRVLSDIQNKRALVDAELQAKIQKANADAAAAAAKATL